MTGSARGRSVGCALLVVLALIAYLPLSGAEYIWDDEDYLLDNKNLRSAQGLTDIWFAPSTSPQYYPLVFTSFWIQHKIHGLHPFGYHLVNVLLHAGSAILLFLLLEGLAIPGAWLAAAFFCAHPVHVESVAWVAERKNVLSGFFYFAALAAYLRWALGRGSDPQAETKDYRGWGVALGMFVLALLSKTVTASLPVAVLLILWWKRGRLEKRDILPLLPFFAVGAAFGLTTAWLEKTLVGAVGAEWELGAAKRILIAGRALWFYLGKLAWPDPLIFNYPRWEINPQAGWQYLFPLGFLATSVALWFWRGRVGRGPLAAALFFFATLFPALGFIDTYPMLFSWVADHFQYLASVGPLTLAAAAAAWCWTRRGLSPLAGRALAALAIAALALLTFLRCYAFFDRRALWEDTVRKNPRSWLALSNLGVLEEDRGDFRSAEIYARAAAAIDPERALLVNNIGTALVQQGRLDEAIRYLRLALEKDPNLGPAWSNLGDALYRQGKLAEATAAFEKAVAVSPEMPALHNNLASAYAEDGRYDEARRHFEEALRQNPDYGLAHYNYGVILFRIGRAEEALVQYALALGSGTAVGAAAAGRVPSPEEAARWRQGTFIFGGEGWGIDFASVHNNLGNVLQSLERYEEAVDHIAEAIRLKPDFAEAHYNLGVALAGLGRLEDAVASYRRSLAIDPRHANVYNNLGVALAKLGRQAEAIAAYREALGQQPGHAAAWTNLGNSLTSTGAIDAAIAAYRSALSLEPTLVEAHFNLAIALRAAGRAREAREEFSAALRLRPGLTEARQALAELDRPRGGRERPRQ